MVYNPISSSILTVRLAAKPCNLTLIQVYSPIDKPGKRRWEERLLYSYLPTAGIQPST